MVNDYDVDGNMTVAFILNNSLQSIQVLNDAFKLPIKLIGYFLNTYMN